MRDLHGLLVTAGARPPYVVGGHSLGGFLAELFASRYRDEVAGVVLADATPPLAVRTLGISQIHDGRSVIDLGGAAAELGRARRARTSTGPRIVLEHGVVDIPQWAQRIWHRGQVDLARGAGALLVRASSSGHDIPADQPKLVSAALTSVVRAVRMDGPLPRCPRALRRAGGVCEAR